MSLIHQPSLDHAAIGQSFLAAHLQGVLEGMSAGFSVPGQCFHLSGGTRSDLKDSILDELFPLSTGALDPTLVSNVSTRLSLAPIPKLR